MARPLIALLTDFGLRDHYVGTMKGVVLGICPEATLVDISHDVSPHDVLARRAGARRGVPLLSVGHDFSRGRRSRRGIDTARHCRRSWATIGSSRPDNGVLSVVLDELPAPRAVELTDLRYARPTISQTFEGRDRFASGGGLAGEQAFS